MAQDKNTDSKEHVSISDKERWMEKWNISEEQLKEAIVRTDSTEVDEIEKFLINHKYI